MNVLEMGFGGIISLPDVVTNAVWIRPYAGAGISVVRSSLHSTSAGLVSSENRVGHQALGGAEFTWANVPHLAVSAEWRHLWVVTPFSGFETGGRGFALSAHWYFR
jgi:opacity protein-like surface antigen